MTRRSARLQRSATAFVAVVVASACGSKTTAPPQPGETNLVAPDLRGSSVLLLPVQTVFGVRGDPNAELAYALKETGREVDWIEEEAVTNALRRAPGVDARTRGLPVGQFLMAEVNRIGDPLYGQLRRLSAMVDADWVLLPVAATFEANQAVEGSTPRVRLTAALIQARSGRVYWFGIEEGGDFEQDDPRGLASAVESVARSLLWYAR